MYAKKLGLYEIIVSLNTTLNISHTMTILGWLVIDGFSKTTDTLKFELFLLFTILGIHIMQSN